MTIQRSHQPDLDIRSAALIRRICHDLTQPLTALQGYIELALAAGQNAAEMRQGLVDASEESERLAELMRAVRTYIDAAIPVPQPQCVELRKVVADAIAEMPNCDGEASHTVFAELDRQSCPVSADPDRLKTAIQILLDFSLARAAAALTVSLEVSAKSRKLVIVSRGLSLAPMDREGLFDLHTSSRTGKIGAADRFRLAAAAATLAQANGRVSARSGKSPDQMIVEIIFAPTQET